MSGGQDCVQHGLARRDAGQPVEAKPSAWLSVAHDGCSEVHQAATPVDHGVKITFGFGTPLQYPGESAHPNILPIFQASHFWGVGSHVLQARLLVTICPLAGRDCYHAAVVGDPANCVLTSTRQVTDVVIASAWLAGPATCPLHQVKVQASHIWPSHLVVGHDLLVVMVIAIGFKC